MLEFFWTTNKSRLMVHDLEKDEIFPLSPEEGELLYKIDGIINENYPDTAVELIRIYGDGFGYKFPRVNRFLKCNFSVHDNRPDIDDDWNFDFETVPCPLRGECKDGICKPKLSSKLTHREKDVIKLHVEGLTQVEIGDRLYISERTAHNHISNIYKKLGFTGQANPAKLLINYAYKNKLI